MLEPNQRLLYMAELRPPEGYRLDQAVGTTYSLDLLALLMAPLSMVLWDYPDQKDVLQNPMLLLESIRRAANRVVIFCHEGQIAVPKQDTLLYSLLEPTVVQAQPPNRGGGFHPKLWLLRYVADDQPVRYRFLCLSRNLTFDRSWDTLLALEGVLVDRRVGFGSNRPLADFLLSLPGLATHALPDGLDARLESLADEVRRVRFQAPQGFDDGVQFLPSGIRGYPRQPDLDWRWRCMVVSPFLSEGWLPNLQHRDGGVKNVLVSRQESLDVIPDRAWSQIEQAVDVYVMDEVAEHGDDMEARADAASANAPDRDLSGLHAKLYITHDKGWRARLRTGSANATEAALGGENVEFTVQLEGLASTMGIDTILGKPNDQAAWGKLLTPYRRPPTPKTPDPILQQLEGRLTKARNAIVGARLCLDVSKPGEGGYMMCLRADHPLDSTDMLVEGRCWPITAAIGAHELTPLWQGEPIWFRGLSLEALTGFVAFELHARECTKEACASFVLNLPVRGMPSEREQAIVRRTLGDRNGFLRYLRFLLADDAQEVAELLVPVEGERGESRGPVLTDLGVPLLEELVRAYSRRPEQIDRIAHLVDSLKSSLEGRELIPEDFAQVWEAFVTARRGGRK